ncbi:hypothetical protein GJ744_010632 [Endocarpon pusillum]|uniref:C2H2-type domain-containing protein n=1 Tax=Endocarpon pusillum TaxID=364733 RepID=A0A8H7EAY2_9EURO|nr:hypothetical protein GJ744_010632 [Endocarpon pusillum]
MSAFVSVMPSPMSQFERSQDFFHSTQYPSNAEYGEMASLPIRSYNEVPDHRTQEMSPNSSTSSSSTGHSTSYGRSSKGASRSPPTRQRTPIRHSRPPTSRVQSSGRPEALLAYAAHQEFQTASSQSMASSQAAYPPSAYMMPPVTSAYHSQSGYYSSTGGPQQQQSSHYVPSSSSYNVTPNPPTYLPLGRSASYPIESLPSIQASDSLFQPQLGSNVSSWQSSTAAPQLPSMCVPSSHSYSSSPASSMETAEGIRVLASRPKPQCFDHGCNGRQFSTFSNLLRHQREKSGSASKATCPHCGTEFTRTTARNGHLYGGKCKGRDGQGAPETDA